MKSFNLNHIILPISSSPVREGDTESYYERSFQEILDDQDPHELKMLNEWMKSQFMAFFDDALETEGLCESDLQIVLELYEELNVKPTGCRYDPFYGEQNENNE